MKSIYLGEKFIRRYAGSYYSGLPLPMTRAENITVGDILRWSAIPDQPGCYLVEIIKKEGEHNEGNQRTENQKT